MIVARGRMGMDRAEFWDITPREFFNKMQGWKDQKRADTETDVYYQRLWTTYLINIHLSKSDKIDPPDLYKFEWELEKGEAAKIPSKEEVRKAIEDMRQREKKYPKKVPATFDDILKINNG